MKLKKEVYNKLARKKSKVFADLFEAHFTWYVKTGELDRDQGTVAGVGAGLLAYTPALVFIHYATVQYGVEAVVGNWVYLLALPAVIPAWIVAQFWVRQSAYAHAWAMTCVDFEQARRQMDAEEAGGESAPPPQNQADDGWDDFITGFVAGRRRR